MIDGLKPCPEYRDSEVSWFGPMPAPWNVRRLKAALRELDCRPVQEHCSH